MQYAGAKEALRKSGGGEGSPAVVAEVGEDRGEGEGEEKDAALDKQVINVTGEVSIALEDCMSSEITH